MEDFEMFLNLGAVVRIRKFENNDLYKFVKLVRSFGLLNKYLNWFVLNMKIIEIFGDDGKVIEDKNLLFEKIMNATDEEFYDMLDNGYTDSNFWHLVELNNGICNNICIEFQYGKGFTFDNEENYTDYDNEIEVLSVDELIDSCGKKDLFNMDYVSTTVCNEYDNKIVANILYIFCEFYEWELVKYKNGKYNILDIQTGDLRNYDSQYTLQEVLEEIFYRMVGYFTTEEDIDGLIEEGSYDYLRSTIEDYRLVAKAIGKESYAEDDFNEILEEIKKVEKV